MSFFTYFIQLYYITCNSTINYTNTSLQSRAIFVQITYYFFLLKREKKNDENKFYLKNASLLCARLNKLSRILHEYKTEENIVEHCVNYSSLYGKIHPTRSFIREIFLVKKSSLLNSVENPEPIYLIKRCQSYGPQPIRKSVIYVI